MNAAEIISEAFEGPVLAILRKYHLVDEASGDIRIVRVNKEPGNFESETIETPMIDPEVIQKFLTLDRSSKKRTFDWMLFAAGGGAAAKKMSEAMLSAVHKTYLDSRTGDPDPRQVDEDYTARPEAFEAFAEEKGFASFDKFKQAHQRFSLKNGLPIDPMTFEEAEEDWQVNALATYKEAYEFGDQDIASDATFPVFGYYVKWPGRNDVYEKVFETVSGFNQIISDKKRISEYNRLQPKNPFQTSLWKPDGSPLYPGVDELLNVVKNFNRVCAERRARSNKLYFGRAQPPQTGWVKSREGIIYEDENIFAAAPATAGGSRHDPDDPRSGELKWCTANHTHWDNYFAGNGDYRWGTYAQHGPLVYVTFKQTLNDGYLQRFAMHCRYARNKEGKLSIENIEFWDKENRARPGNPNNAMDWQEVKRRIEAEGKPELMDSFLKAVEAVKDWYSTLKPADIELDPPLESLAQKLVGMLLDS